MPAALLFDLDGTLLDTDPLHRAVFTEMFAARGVAIDHAFYLREIHGRVNEPIFARHFPDEDPVLLSDLKEATFRERLAARVPPTPGIGALLDHAAAEGIAVAVVTNAPRANAEAMLAACGLATRFETVIVGADCAAPKPDPAPYAAAMDRLGAAPGQCVAFEDSPGGIASARGAGAYCVGLRSSLDDGALRAAGAALSIADFTDTALPAVLARLRQGCP